MRPLGCSDWQTLIRWHQRICNKTEIKSELTCWQRTPPRGIVGRVCPQTHSGQTGWDYSCAVVRRRETVWDDHLSGIKWLYSDRPLRSGSAQGFLPAWHRWCSTTLHRQRTGECFWERFLHLLQSVPVALFFLPGPPALPRLQLHLFWPSYRGWSSGQCHV